MADTNQMTESEVLHFDFWAAASRAARYMGESFGQPPASWGDVERAFLRCMEVAPDRSTSSSPVTAQMTESEVRQILDGIDRKEPDNDGGWWETSAGAAFGAAKLAELLAALTRKDS